MNLIEIMIAIVVTSLYIVMGYGWYATLQNVSLHDIHTVEHAEMLTSELSKYPSYESIVGKSPSQLLQITSTTTLLTTFTDIDRMTSDVTVHVSDTYGRDSVVGRKLFSRYSSGQNSSWCSLVAFATSTNFRILDSLSISQANFTAMAAYGRYIIVTNNTTTASHPDLYMIDTQPNLHVINNLDTGPGIADVAIGGRYAYAANTSTIGQLQIIDVASIPRVIATLKLNLPTSTTTPTIGSTITYADGYAYLGTEKWNGPELYAINVIDPASPINMYGAETSSMVQDIVADGVSIFVALSGDPQFAEYRLNAGLTRTWGYSPLGWQSQEGKRISVLPRQLFIGRTLGGFNLPMQHELFVFERTNATPIFSSSTDIGRGVYGLYVSGQRILTVLNGNPSSIGWVSDTTKSIRPTSVYNLSEAPRDVLCSGDKLYVLGQNSITTFGI